MQINFSTNRTSQGKPMKLWQGILFGLVFVAFGIVILRLAISSIKTYNEKNKTFIEITSKVVDYEYDDEGLQAIVVEYIVDGQAYHMTSNSYSNMPKSIGTEVLVKYNPDDPQDAIWSSDSSNILFPLIGVVFILSGITILIFSIIKSRKQKMIESEPIMQSNGLYSNVEVQPQVNNVNSNLNTQNMQSINNADLTQANSLNQTFTQPVSNVSQTTNNYNEPINQPINNNVQPQVNNLNQVNSSVDSNNQNNNINTNM